MVDKKKDKESDKKLTVKKDKVKKLNKDDLKKVGGGMPAAGEKCTPNCPGHGGTWIQGKTVS